MLYNPPLVLGVLQRRYQRFLADVQLSESFGCDGGGLVTAHCPNPGSMLGLCTPGMRVGLRAATSPGRRCAWTLEMVDASSARAQATWVGVNTHNGNRLVAEALAEKRIPELAMYTKVRAEVAYDTNSRCDFVLSTSDADAASTCFVEVKTVTLSRRLGVAEFPDSVTARGTKQVQALARLCAVGHRAMLVYLVQRSDCETLALASDIDPAYARACAAAIQQGLEILVYDCEVTLAHVRLRRRLALVDHGC